MSILIRYLGWHCALLASVGLLGLAATARAETLSEHLLADAVDGRLDSLDFAAACLVASGVENPRELAAWQDLYAIRRAELVAAVELATEPLPSAIHAELHERLLTGRYRADSSDLRSTIRDGDYNCLSALALYYDCCSAAGLEVEIWLGRGHVSARLSAHPSKNIEPGATHWVTRPISDSYEPARHLSPVELLGKFYYNRGVEQLQQARFEEGLALLETSTRLDPHDKDAQGNFLAGLNNWAVSRLRDRQYEHAATLIERGLARDAAFAPLVANERLVRAMLGK